MFGPLLRRSQPRGPQFRPALRPDATAAVLRRCGMAGFDPCSRSSVLGHPIALQLRFSVFSRSRF